MCQSPSSLTLSTRRTHAVTLVTPSSRSERGAQRSRGPSSGGAQLVRIADTDVGCGTTSASAVSVFSVQR